MAVKYHPNPEKKARRALHGGGLGGAARNGKKKRKSR